MTKGTNQIHFSLICLEISFFFFFAKLPSPFLKLFLRMLVRSFSEITLKCCYKPELEGSPCGFDL